MNDLHYIFYKAKVMLTDTMDIADPDTELAHRRLCDYIWAMDRPPKANDKFLRQFTRVEDSHWGRVKRGLQDKGWFTAGDFFLHRGAILALNEAAKKFAANYNQTAAGRGAKPLVGVTDAVTGIIAYAATPPLTAPVTPAVTEPVTSGHRTGQDRTGQESSPPIVSEATEMGSGEEPGGPTPEIPTVEAAVAMTMTAGIPPEFTRHVYDAWSLRSGKDASGVIVPWLPYVMKRWKHELVEWQAGTHRGNRKRAANGSENGTAVLILKQKSLERVEGRLRTLRGQSPFNANDPRRAELATLKAARDTLIKELGMPA